MLLAVFLFQLLNEENPGERTLPPPSNASVPLGPAPLLFFDREESRAGVGPFSECFPLTSTPQILSPAGSHHRAASSSGHRRLHPTTNPQLSLYFPCLRVGVVGDCGCVGGWLYACVCVRLCLADGGYEFSAWDPCILGGGVGDLADTHQSNVCWPKALPSLLNKLHNHVCLRLTSPNSSSFKQEAEAGE